MTPFAFRRATSVADALTMGTEPGAAYLAGGTNLVDLMREGCATPASLVDVSRLSSGISPTRDGGLLIGAGETNADLASNPIVCARYPLLAEAILNGATGQIRNMATAGGNILQRTRCLYFYDGAARCNKREPGSGCDAIEGHNRGHAIFGGSEHCVATHPSDMCVALAALNARVLIEGRNGPRSIPIGEFHRTPGNEPQRDNHLAPGELIVAIELPSQAPTMRSNYRKVRERASYAFALVSVATMLDIRDGEIFEARIALGSVAAKPWRAFEAESALLRQKPGEDVFEAAAAASVAGAQPLRDNRYKVELVRRLVARTLGELAEREVRA